MFEAGLDRFDRRALPLHEMRRYDAAADPPAHVRQQPRRYRRRRLPLVRRPGADRQSVKDALAEVDERMSDVPVRRRRGDRARAGTSIKTDQNESRQVTQRPLVGFDRLAFVPATVGRVLLAISPAGPNQLRGLIAGQPSVARAALSGQCDPDNAVVQIFLGMVIDRGPQGF